MILPLAQMKKYGGRDSFQIAKTEAFLLENGISHSLPFRATKDVDIVLIVESITAEFASPLNQ